MRPDGTRVKEASTIVSALPYVMPRRYDAQNFITEYADMEVLRRYIQEKRREGVRIPYMTLILAAYFKAYQENPKINRFIMKQQDLPAQPLLRQLRHPENARRRPRGRDVDQGVL